jgi:hypothetical protein
VIVGRTPIPGVDPNDAKQRACNRAFLKAHPMCAVVGCGRRARHADHIRTVRAAPRLRYDWSNLEPLCHSHHSRLTGAYDSGSIRGACDVDGNPLDPGHPWAQADNQAAIVAVNADQRADPVVAARLKRRFVRDVRSR